MRPRYEEILKDPPTLPYGQHERLPEVSGVYIIKTRRRVLYVGQSNCIRRRIKTHPDRRWFGSKRGISIAWIAYPRLDRFALERKLIAHWNPLLNQQFRADGRSWVTYVKVRLRWIGSKRKKNGKKRNG